MAAPVLSLYIFFLTAISGTISDISDLTSNDLCTDEGGVCQNTYEGCKDGKFLKELCPGPAYWQCCVLKARVQDTPAPWRMCYECSYTVFDGKPGGQENCYDFNNDTGSQLPLTNCSSNCTKEWLKLDKDNYQIIRRCANNCQPFSVFSNHEMHCCHGELCNSSRSTYASSLPFIIRMVALLLLAIVFVRSRH